MEQLQCILYATAYFIPISLFAFYPLRYFTRFKVKTAFLLNLCYAIPNILIYFLTTQYLKDYVYVAGLLFALINCTAYLILYTIDFGRKLFNFLLIVNLGNFIAIFSTFLVYLLFPQSASISYHWRNIVCVLLTEAVFLTPSFLFIKHYSDSMIRNSDYDYIWRLAWVIPLLLSGTGFTIVYSDSITAGSFLGILAKKSALCGSILLCLLLIYAFIAKLINAQHNVLQLKNDLYQHSIQKMQLEKIETQIQDTRVLRHDLRHHVLLMCNYVDNQEYNKLKEYLHQYKDSITKITTLHYTDNGLVNTLLVYYADLCQSEHIEFDAKISIPKILPILDNELTILFGNLLENAHHACLEMADDQKRFMHVRATCKANSFFIVTIDNSYTNKTIRDACGNFLTTKADGTGLGLRSVQELIKKYNGYCKVEPENNIFRVSISIPMNERGS